jgi:hypothetical protein
MADIHAKYRKALREATGDTPEEYQQAAEKIQNEYEIACDIISDRQKERRDERL